MAIILKVVARNDATGVTREFETPVTEAQYADVVAAMGHTRPAVGKEELKEKTIAALAKQVELLDECNDAAKAQIMQQKFDVLNRTLRTLWMV